MKYLVNLEALPGFHVWANGYKNRMIQSIALELAEEKKRKEENAEYIRKSNENPPPKV